MNSERSEFVQITIDGEETDADRERPGTFLWCPETEQWVLRSLRFDWPHELVESPEAVDCQCSDTEENEVEDEAEKVGGLYDITLSFSVDFRFRIPAYSEHEAEERASDLVDYPNNCADMFQVHSEHREVKEIFEDDSKIPDGWDPYGNERLWEVYGDA